MSRRLVRFAFVVLLVGASRQLGCALAALTDSAGSFCLVTEGKAQATLVVPAGSPEIVELGAEAIQERVRGLTGLRLPFSERAEGPSVSLAVNPDADSVLGDEGFLVIVTNTGASITGRGPRGVYHGANWLARRILPRKGKDAWLPQLRVRERPVLQSRGVYDAEWESWVSLGLDVELDAAWWTEYIGLLSSFAANRFEFCDFLTSALPSSEPDSRWQRLLQRNRAIAEFAHVRGMELLATWTANVPASVLEAHPAWRAVGDKGSLICPSNPEALNYLLTHRRQVLEAEGNLLDGVVLYGYDPGGCECVTCGGRHRDWYRTWMKLVNHHEMLFREVAPRVRAVPVLWLFRPEEREQILRHLDEWSDIEEIEAEIFSFDPKLLEIMRGFASRKRMIHWDHESDMEGIMWLENPFFSRIRERIRRTCQMGYRGAMGFVLSHPVKLLNSLYLVQQAWNPERPEGEVLRELVLGLFATDNKRLIEALKELEAWSEAIGPTYKRLASRDNPQTASPAELRRALKAISRARKLLLQAERSVNLRKDYWRYLVNLASAEESIVRRLLAQSRAYAAWDEADAQETLEGRLAKLSQAAQLLAEANRENAAIAEALRTTPLANMRQDLFHTREGILNDELVAHELEQLEAGRELLSNALVEWKKLESAPWVEPSAERRVLVVVGFQEAAKNAVVHCSVDTKGAKAARVFELDSSGTARPLSAIFLPGAKGGLDRVGWLMPGIGSLRNFRRFHIYFGSEAQPSASVARLAPDYTPLDFGFEERARWWRWHGPAGGKLSWSSEGHEGRWAAQVEVARSGAYVVLEATEGNARIMALEPGKIYRFRFFARVIRGRPQFYANIYGGSEADGPHVFGNLTPDNKWHEVTLTVPAPDCPGDTLLWPRLVALEQEQVLLIDEFRIEAEEPPSEQLVDLKDLISGELVDPSMEGREALWELDSSSSPAVRACWSPEGHKGRSAARLEILKESPNEWALLRTGPENSHRLHARPAETYRVSFWCRRVKGAPRFYLDFYGGSPESDGPETYPMLPADTNWHRFVVPVRAPDCPANIVLALRFVVHSEVGTLLIDDVRAEPAGPVIFALGPCQYRR